MPQVTINNNIKSRPERPKFIHLLYFNLSGFDLKFLLIVNGGFYESGLLWIHFVCSMLYCANEINREQCRHQMAVCTNT